MPPAMRAAQRGGGGAESDALRQRVRGLLNRLAESNLAGIAGQVADLMPQEGRLAVTQALSAELLNVRARWGALIL